MSNQASTLDDEVDDTDMPNISEILDYLRQSAEADEKLREFAEELVRDSELRELEVQALFQAHMRDLRVYQGFVDCVINHLLGLATQYEEVPDELQYRLAAMEGMLHYLHMVALSIQDGHEQAITALVKMRDVIETIRMQQAENPRDQQEDRPKPCFLRILRVWQSIL